MRRAQINYINPLINLFTMSCITCKQQTLKTNEVKISNAIEVGRTEAKAKGYNSFAVVERINGTGFFWVALDDERIERLTVVGYYLA